MKKKKQPKAAKGCLCRPAPKPLYPVSDHMALCSVSKRFTVNGRIIADLMHSEKIRGNVKDHVVLSGSSLLDCEGTFEMRHTDEEGGEGRLTVPAVCIVHKRKLHKIIGDKQAARFWKPGFGRVKHG